MKSFQVLFVLMILTAYAAQANSDFGDRDQSHIVHKKFGHPQDKQTSSGQNSISGLHEITVPEAIDHSLAEKLTNQLVDLQGTKIPHEIYLFDMVPYEVHPGQ